MFTTHLAVLAIGISAILGGAAYLHSDLQAIPVVSDVVVGQQVTKLVGAETQRYELTGSFADVLTGPGTTAEAVKIPKNVKHAILTSNDAQAYVVLSEAPDGSLFLTPVTRTVVGIPTSIGSVSAPITDIATVYAGPVAQTSIAKTIYGWTLDAAAPTPLPAPALGNAFNALDHLGAIEHDIVEQATYLVHHGVAVNIPAPRV